MAGTKRTPKVTTRASFNGEEGADKAPSTPMERQDSIHADPENPPSGKLGEEVPPTEDVLVSNGMVKVVAKATFQCYSALYPLEKGKSTYVHKDHLPTMLNADVVRLATEEDQ